MSGRNKGMQSIYDGLQDDNLQKKEAEFVETINNILKHESETSLINRKTKVSDNYSTPTLDLIANHLEKKYYNKNDKNDLAGNVMADNINTWTKSYKDISVSVNGWLISNILDTFKGFVEMVKQRSLGDRLTGKNKEGN